MAELKEEVRDLIAEIIWSYGATPAQLRERARQVLTAPNNARATKIHTLAEAADEVERLAHELHTLIAAARDARKDNPGVPAVKSRRTSAPKASAKTPPVPFVGDQPTTQIKSTPLGGQARAVSMTGHDQSPART